MTGFGRYGIATLPAVPGPALAEWRASRGGKPLVARTLFIIKQTEVSP